MSIDGEIETASNPGRPTLVDNDKADNIRLKNDHGTSATHAIARLKRDNPELADKVVKGELSANAAAIQAGFRRPKIQVPTDDVTLAARTLVRHFGERIDELLASVERVRNA